MAYMNYIELLNRFYDLLQRSQVSNNAQLLYYTLLQIDNKCSWSDWFARTNVSLSGMMCISENAMKRARAELKQLGLIDFKPSKKRGEATLYHITVSFCTPQMDTQSDTYSDTQRDTQMDTQSDTINKQKQKQNEKKDTKVSKEKRFAPPSVEAVAEYCQKRGNNVDPQRFVDFYQAKGWMVGNNRMTDWQAAVRTWEQRDKTKDFARPGTIGGKELSRNQFHNFSQRDTDYDAIALERARMRFGGGEPDGGEKGDAG